MSGISLKVEIDDVEIRARLAAMIERMQQPLGFYQNVGRYLTQVAVPRNFDQERSPEGIPWARLMPTTIAQREKKGQVPIKILVATKTLRGSIISQATNTEVRVGSSAGVKAPYAAIHQLGGMAGRNRKVRIPARPYLGLSAEDQEEIIAIAKDWLAAE